MKKLILLLTVIAGVLLCQSCFCEHDLFGPGYPPPHHHVHHGHYGW